MPYRQNVLAAAYYFASLLIGSVPLFVQTLGPFIAPLLSRELSGEDLAFGITMFFIPFVLAALLIAIGYGLWVGKRWARVGLVVYAIWRSGAACWFLLKQELIGQDYLMLFFTLAFTYASVFVLFSTRFKRINQA